MTGDMIGGPYKLTRQLAKWNHTPEELAEIAQIQGDGNEDDPLPVWQPLRPPDEVLDAAWWYEVDGTEITDPERIAELERKVQEETTGPGVGNDPTVGGYEPLFGPSND
jgi:hypothetical protein